MKKLLLGILLLGIAARITVFFQNRSVFLDEANLARNIVEKPVLDFFHPLDYEQYAPPFFLILEKGSVQLLGPNEYALRLIPLIAGILALFVFYQILKRKYEATHWAWFPLILFAFSPELIRYSSEIKQYMVDVGVSIGLIGFALYFKPEKWQVKSGIFWAITGSLIIWLSMPSVFILAGIGFHYFFSFYQERQFTRLLQMLAISTLWLISFGIFYQQLIRPSLETQILVNYHSQYFLPLFPTSSEEWTKAGSIILNLFKISFGHTVLAYAVGIGTFLTGAYALYKQQISLLLLFLSPILCCLLASGLGYYSLMPRLSLFLIPLILFISSMGIKWVGNKTEVFQARWFGYVALVVFAIVAFGVNGYQYFFKKMEIEELRPLMVRIQPEVSASSLIYLHNEAAPAFFYYQNLKRPPLEIPEAKIYAAKWDEMPDQALSEPGQYEQVWLVFSHLISDHARTIRDNNLATIPGHYIFKKKIETTGAAAYLFVAIQN